MLERTETRFGMKPASLAADSAYGSADSLAWLVKKKEIAPHIPFDKSNRTDGTFSRVDFKFDPGRDRYACPAGKEPRRHGPKPEAAGPTKTDERAFAGDGRITPVRTARGPTRNASYLISKPARFQPKRTLADFFNDIDVLRT